MEDLETGKPEAEKKKFTAISRKAESARRLYHSNLCMIRNFFQRWREKNIHRNQ